MSCSANRSLEKPKMVRSRCLRLWWNNSGVKQKGKASCQIRHQRLQGWVEEDHHQYHDMEWQELQAAEEEEAPMMKGKDLDGSQISVGKGDGMRDPHPSQKKKTSTSRKMNSLTCSLES